jgi:hypothetical protein
MKSDALKAGMSILEAKWESWSKYTVQLSVKTLVAESVATLVRVSGSPSALGFCIRIFEASQLDWYAEYGGFALHWKRRE